jgi:outer membrane biogenesis lipoprotein LolB
MKFLSTFVLFTFTLLASFLLTACAAPSLGEIAASEPNPAKLAGEENTVEHYDKQPAGQLRMFIYTEFDKKGRNEKGRDGYFIDFIE